MCDPKQAFLRYPLQMRRGQLRILTRAAIYYHSALSFCGYRNCRTIKIAAATIIVAKTKTHPTKHPRLALSSLALFTHAAFKTSGEKLTGSPDFTRRHVSSCLGSGNGR